MKMRNLGILVSELVSWFINRRLIDDFFATINQ